MLTGSQLLAVGEHLARSGVGQQAITADPWAFVPAAAQQLANPSLTPELRSELSVASAVALGRLGLRTVALELLEGCDRLPAQLREMLAGLPSDEVSLQARIAAVQANLAALPPAVAESLRAALPGWSAGDQPRAFRTSSGVTVLFRGPSRWSLFLNDHALVQSIAKLTASDGPYYLDGFRAPLMVERLFRLTTTAVGVVQCKLALLAANEHEALTSLSLREIPRVLSSSRVELWVGADVPNRLREETSRRILCRLGMVLTMVADPDCAARWPAREPAQIMAAANAAQLQETKQAERALAQFNAEVLDTSLAERLADPASPLRVLIPTTRFSTYVQHSAEDLAQALRAIGCEVRVVMEPDDQSAFVAAAMMSITAAFRPNLVIFINTLRSQVASWTPANVPAVTWVQDAMPHLFFEQPAGALGERDCIVGHLHAAMLERQRIPRKRTLYSPVLASDVKFHAAPVSAADRARYECELAYVSHRAEPPESFAARLAAADPAGSMTRRLLVELVPAVIEAAQQASVGNQPLLESLHEITHQQLVRLGGAEAARQLFSQALYQIAHPLAELTLRQQMIGWAAELCDRRGWRLKLYGRGWDQHPRFASYAEGPLPHDESLRIAYQSARSHLHAGLGGVHHQRVLECALSGGCTLVRIKADDLRQLEWWAQNEITREADAKAFEPVEIRGGQYLRTPVANHAPSMIVHALYDRVGAAQQHPLTGWQVVAPEQVRTGPGREAVSMREAWLAGDLSSSGFWSQESFERAACAVIESSERRESLASWQRASAASHYSLRSFARRVLELAARNAAVPLATNRS